MLSTYLEEKVSSLKLYEVAIHNANNYRIRQNSSYFSCKNISLKTVSFNIQMDIIKAKSKQSIKKSKIDSNAHASRLIYHLFDANNNQRKITIIFLVAAIIRFDVFDLFQSEIDSLFKTSTDKKYIKKLKENKLQLQEDCFFSGSINRMIFSIKNIYDLSHRKSLFIPLIDIYISYIIDNLIFVRIKFTPYKTDLYHQCLLIYQQEQDSSKKPVFKDELKDSNKKNTKKEAPWKSITKELLTTLVWSKPTTDIAKQFGITEASIRKKCKSMNINKPNRGFWRKVQTGKIDHPNGIEKN